MRNFLLAVIVVGLLGPILGCSKAQTDDSISNNIKANMFSDAQTKSANVNVVVKNGVVTLTGEVPDENTRYEAFKIAKEAPGVVNVDDQMTLPQSPAAASAQGAATNDPAPIPARPPKREREREREQQLVRRPLAGDSSPYGATSGAQDFAQQQPAAQPTPAAAPAAPPRPRLQRPLPSGTSISREARPSISK